MNKNEITIDHNPKFSAKDEQFFASQAKEGFVTYYSGLAAETLINEGQGFLEKDADGGVYSDQ